MLKAKRIPFYIRIKEGSVVRTKGKRLYKAKTLFRDVTPLQHCSAPMQIEIFGVTVYLEGSRSKKGELMIIATDKPAQNAIAKYLRRWEVENLFQSLKGRGFHFEETHLTEPERIEKLMVILSLGFCLAHKIGEWRTQQKPIPFKKFRDSSRSQQSFFRYGFDFIRDFFLQPTKKIPFLRKLFHS